MTEEKQEFSLQEFVYKLQTNVSELRSINLDYQADITQYCIDALKRIEAERTQSDKEIIALNNRILILLRDKKWLLTMVKRYIRWDRQQEPDENMTDITPAAMKLVEQIEATHE